MKDKTNSINPTHINIPTTTSKVVTLPPRKVRNLNARQWQELLAQGAARKEFLDRVPWLVGLQLTRTFAGKAATYTITALETGANYLNRPVFTGRCSVQCDICHTVYSSFTHTVRSGNWHCQTCTVRAQRRTGGRMEFSKEEAHGTSHGYNLGCDCELCRAAYKRSVVRKYQLHPELAAQPKKQDRIAEIKARIANLNNKTGDIL